MNEELEEFVARTGLEWEAAKTLLRRIEILDEFRAWQHTSTFMGMDAFVASHRAKQREYNRFYTWKYKDQIKARMKPKTKAMWAALKNDPEKLAQHYARERAKYARRKESEAWKAKQKDPTRIRHNKETRKRYRAWQMEKLKQDPIAYEAYLEQRRQGAARRREARIRRFSHVAP